MARAEQRLRDGIVLGDQRPDLRRAAAVAAEQEARDAAVALGDQFGGRQAAAQASQQRAAVGAEGGGVIGAESRPNRHRRSGGWSCRRAAGRPARTAARSRRTSR